MATRKAVIIVPGYRSAKETLKSPDMSAAAARPVLEGEFGVFEGATKLILSRFTLSGQGYTVTVMSDREGMSEALIPTRNNIVRFYLYDLSCGHQPPGCEYSSVDGLDA
jgi:hypothetical protein